VTDSATLAKIGSIPRDFRAGLGSPAQLVARSGYRSVGPTLTAAELVEFLQADPTLVEDWYIWSQDKRTSTGWYLSLYPAGGSIGYVGRADPELRFASHVEACAEFIVRELASIDSDEPYRDREQPER
jgi:hypothetical protein